MKSTTATKLRPNNRKPFRSSEFVPEFSFSSDVSKELREFINTPRFVQQRESAAAEFQLALHFDAEKPTSSQAVEQLDLLEEAASTMQLAIRSLDSSVKHPFQADLILAGAEADFLRKLLGS